MNMSREEAISLLGEENATRVNEGIQNGTLDYSEFQRICKEAFPVPQQSSLVRNVIFNQLSKKECFNMFESNKEKQAQYAQMAEMRERAEKGELTQEDLKQLCDKVFGNDSAMSRKVQKELIDKGKVKQSDTQITKRLSNKEDGIHEKKSWELEPDEKKRIQDETAEIAKKYRDNEEKQSHTQDLQHNQSIQPGEYQQEQNR